MVAVDRVGLVSQQEHVRGIPLIAKALGLRLFRLIEHGAAVGPYILQVKPAAPQTFTFVHAVHYHACQLTDTTLGVFLHDSLHIFHASLHVTSVELAQSPYKEELVTIGTHREPCGGNLCIRLYHIIFSCLETFIGRSIKGVFYVHTKPAILHIKRV